MNEKTSAPDREKLLTFADGILAVDAPELSSSESNDVVAGFVMDRAALAQEIKVAAETIPSTPGLKLYEIKVQCTTTDRYRVLAVNEEAAIEAARYSEDSEMLPPHYDDEPYTNWETAECSVISEKPTHQLVCEGCGNAFTVSAEFDLADCPKCGRDSLSERQKRRDKYAELRSPACPN